MKEKEKNIITMEILNMMVNISMEKDGKEQDMIIKEIKSLK